MLDVSWLRIEAIARDRQAKYLRQLTENRSPNDRHHKGDR